MMDLELECFYIYPTLVISAATQCKAEFTDILINMVYETQRDSTLPVYIGNAFKILVDQ